MSEYGSMFESLERRIAELEAENAELLEEVKEQDEREAKWAKRFDQQIGHFAVRLYNSRKMRILIARRRISALRKENAALKERWEKALSEAREAAGHEFGLWPLGAAAITHQLREENTALRRDLATRENEYRILSDHAEQVEGREATLRDAIDSHAAMGHERCHENDKVLYAAAGIEQDCTLPQKEQWLHDCERYWECRKSGIAEWPSVTQLQSELAALREDKARLVEALEEIADGDGCNCRFGPGCDMKCKDIARAAIDAARKEER